jgi:hypothetical protein
MTLLSGKTQRALRAVLTEWPIVSAPMAEALTHTSRAAVQRNFAWMEAGGLIREMTGQGRYRMWRVEIRANRFTIHDPCVQRIRDCDIKTVEF